MNCRLCNSDLESVHDFGNQRLSGQFHNVLQKETYPLHLMTCTNCNLWQLSETVNPDKMFNEYWYRSSISNTMRLHLTSIADEAIYFSSANKRILDIGGNDGYLLSHFFGERYIVDPSNIVSPNDIIRIRDNFPTNKLSGKFDIIFSIAMFYDINNPQEFVEEIKRSLNNNGIWIVEVACRQIMQNKVLYDGICHEHLTYWDAENLCKLVESFGMSIENISWNNCNGGSFRLVVRNTKTKSIRPKFSNINNNDFSTKVKQHRTKLRNIINKYDNIHVLGASTKINTVLQYCDIGVDKIKYASDRDILKKDRLMAMGQIILDEETSRLMCPDAYLVGPYHFRNELISREKGYTNLIFPFPEIEVIEKRNYVIRK